MNKIMMLLVLVAGVAQAETCVTTKGMEVETEVLELNTKVPNRLKGAKIIVETADGKRTEMPIEKYKVVPRKQQRIVTATLATDTVSCSSRNRLSILGGAGPKSGLNVSKSPGTVTIESRDGVVGGLQYQRLLTKELSIGGQVQSNNSALLNLGLDF